VNDRFFTRWDKRRWLTVAWTAVVIASVAALEIIIASATGPKNDSLVIAFRGAFYFYTLIAGLAVWGLGLGVIGSVAGFLDWRSERRVIREVRAEERRRITSESVRRSSS
jgi:hypothetical protein